MRGKRQTNRGRNTRAGGDAGPDLFSQELAGVVKQAFAEAKIEGDSPKPAPQTDAVDDLDNDKNAPVEKAPAVEVEARAPFTPTPERSAEPDPNPVASPAPAPSPLPVAGALYFEPPTDSIPARMLNQFVYCPRLFHYEHVQGVFVESADTVKGAAVHRRVDKGKGALPEATAAQKKKEEEGEEPETKERAEMREAGLKAKSVMMGSERLSVVAKMDLVEATLAGDGSVAGVCPVDYKAGAPREGDEGLEMWDGDRMQLGLQCLVLRDNGYACDHGIIYYSKTKQKVPLEITPELEAWVIRQIAAARVCAEGPIPPPLIDSPKCARCSLAPVCLPDETRMLSIPTLEKFPIGIDQGDAPFDKLTTPGLEPAERLTRDPDSKPEDDRPADPSGLSTINSPPSTSSPPRRLIAPRDEKRALYLNTQGFRVGCHDAVIKVKEKDRVVEEVRAMDVSHVAVFGNIQVSTQAIQRLCDEDIPVTWFSMGGWFYGMTRGHSLKNVLLRIEQFRHAADPASCLRLAKQFVRGKIHNHRVLFMRNHVEPLERTKLRLGQAREDVLATRSQEELLGVEGAAAAVYFQQFGGMVQVEPDDDVLEGVANGVAPKFRFDFTTRNRRPPTDPVNAMLSLAYSLLAKECTLAAYAVGLDPYVGFYHQPRHGRPALALDIMEEFRPLIAESVVLTAINNRFVSNSDFVTAGRAVNLNAAGRKQFFQCFEQRMNSTITHPVFDYKVSYRRALDLQFRILARVLTGEIPEYVPFLTR